VNIREDELTPRMWDLLDAIDHVDEFELADILEDPGAIDDYDGSLAKDALIARQVEIEQEKEARTEAERSCIKCTRVIDPYRTALEDFLFRNGHVKERCFVCGPSDNEITRGPGNSGAITERPDLLSLARDLSGRGVTTDVSNAYIHAVRSGDKSRVAQLRKHVYGLHRIDRGVEHPPSPADFMVNHLDFDFAEMRDDGDWDLHRWEGPPDGSGNSTSFVVGKRARAYKATLVHDDDPELGELCDHPHCLEAACDLCTVCDMIYCAKHAAEDAAGMI